MGKGRIKLDIIGKKFGKLTVLYQVEDEIDKNSGKHKSRYMCQCECTNFKIVRGSDLTGGYIQSCGCLHKEVASNTMKKYHKENINVNKYDLDSYDYGVGLNSNTNKEFYFDKEDYDKIKNIYWFESDRGYISGHIKGGRVIKFHQLILYNIQGTVIDHKNNFLKNDNRKSNLRIALQKQNMKNIRTYKNGLMNGITYKDNMYTVNITVNKSVLFLGYYSSLEDAIKTRLFAEVELYGEFSCRNVPEDYMQIKKDVLKYFKPIHYIVISPKDEFISWINNNCYYDINNKKFIKNKQNGLTIIDFLSKNIRMEFFYKENARFDLVAWGYYGLELIDEKNSCLNKILMYEMGVKGCYGFPVRKASKTSMPLPSVEFPLEYVGEFDGDIAAFEERWDKRKQESLKKFSDEPDKLYLPVDEYTYQVLRHGDKIYKKRNGNYILK